MSYLVLARKSRPANFDQVVGQKPIVRTLHNALVQDRVAHAMIFSGVRGVGKTTLARIMAKSLNCEERREAEPCNGCHSCLEINGGTSVDLIEIDGASNRGIQEIRELKENIRFMPTSSRYKIIIIDEVHMLTTEAFNALLKTLEEPPEHVYFMFATTELHKVPVTILSRCQRYELKRIDSRDMADHFRKLAETEKVEIDPAALEIIIREAGGSIRDGLSLLDQVFSYCGNRVTLEDVTDMLGLVSHQVIADIADALLAGDPAQAFGHLDRVYEYGMDMKRFINDLLAWFRTMVICSLGSGNSLLADLPQELSARARESVTRYPGRTLMLMFNILMEELEKARFSSRPRFVLEMAFIKAVQANEIVPVTTLLGRLDEILAGAPSAALREPGSNIADMKQEAEVPAPKEQDEPVGDKQHTSFPEDEPLKKKEEPGPEVAEATGESSSEGDSAGEVTRPADPVEVPLRKESVKRTIRQNWNDFIEYVRERKLWMASALEVAEGVRLEGNVLVIEYIDPAQCRFLKNKENITPLTEFALDFFQENFRIQFSLPHSKACEIDPANGFTPVQERQALANDALVLTAVDLFNGEVGDIRVGPRFRKPVPVKSDEDQSGTA